MKSTANPRYSPSYCHQRQMKEMVPALAYDGGDVAEWQRRLRRKVRTLLGLPHIHKAPRPARTLWRRDHPLGTIEKVVFTSEPGVDVPAYLCLPAKVEPPYPVMICLQGHTTGMHNSIAVDAQTEKVPIRVPGDRDFGIGCMRRGVAALCMEQRSFGERSERLQRHVSSQGCHDAAMHALMLGRTLAGERVFDVDCAVDYLETRPEIDRKLIGVMGNSGGATVSIFSSAVLPRIRFAMPSCGFCTYRESIMSIYHCSDNYVPRILQFAEASDVLGLFAPKPVVVVAGVKDDIFPIAGVRRAFRDLRRVYRAAEASRRCHLVEGKGGHRFYAAAAWPVMLKEIQRLREGDA
jgi:dienelactone hydrolase